MSFVSTVVLWAPPGLFVQWQDGKKAVVWSDELASPTFAHSSGGNGLSLRLRLFARSGIVRGEALLRVERPVGGVPSLPPKRGTLSSFAPRS
jgi:hypothetical protein